MREQALRGVWATCVCLAISASTAQAAQGDIVLYAADAVRIAGNWARVSETTAAGAQMMASADKGWAIGAEPLAAPQDYVEFTFTAPAQTPHHIWVRMRAPKNDKTNDSVFAQFSDATATGGAPLYRIGTTGGLMLNLALDASGRMNGWGWVDGAYWLSQAATVTFSTTGTHTLRIQTREDGVQFDQIVISPSTWATAAPGQISGDSTIVAKPFVPTATPFSGTPTPIPGTLEAENFDNGGDGLGHHDGDTTNAGGAYRQTGVDIEASADGGYNVGWIAAGEWLGYSVNVQAAGPYVFEARVAAPAGGAAFHVEVAGVNVTGPLAVPATGSWQTWTTVSKIVTLPAGAQQAKVVFDTAGMNLNWLRLTLATSTPYTGSPIALPGTLALDRFDNGGEGIAYHDATTGNSGGVSRATDVDLETSSLGIPDIGWIADGEWVRYSVDVAAAGSYVITATVASPYGGGKMHVTLGSVATETASVPTTGSWQTWQEISWTATLAAGPQALTLVFDAGGFNVASLVVAPSIAPAGPASPPASTSAPVPAITTIRVNAGGDLQAAIDAAQSGDVILLQAGATFIGNFTLPAKNGHDYVTIRTDIADPVPAGTRITPETAVNLATIKSPNNYTALATQPYAHHYVLQLLELQANAGGHGEVISLGDGSSAQDSLAMVPHDIVVDRVYIHGGASGQKRGIGLNSASTSIRDSYIANIWAVGQDSQAIAGWNGPGPYLITNNYLEAASENFLLGGADPAIVDLIPSDITFTRNYVTKPLSWRSRSDINVKNLFELKNAQRVHIEGNIFENNWLAAQSGYAILLTGRSQDGKAPWSVVRDLTFVNNIVRHVSSGINILGKDYRFPSGVATHLVFCNNLFYDVSGKTYGGNGRFMLINGGVDVTIDHNTIVQDGTSVIYADTNPVQQLTMTNNIAPDNAWAVMGGGTAPGNGTIATYFPNAIFLRGVWAGSNPRIYPTGNYYPSSVASIGFADAAHGDYRLSPASLYRNGSLEGTDVGADIDALLAAVANVE